MIVSNNARQALICGPPEAQTAARRRAVNAFIFTNSRIADALLASRRQNR